MVDFSRTGRGRHECRVHFERLRLRDTHDLWFSQQTLAPLLIKWNFYSSWVLKNEIKEAAEAGFVLMISHLIDHESIIYVTTFSVI